MKTLLITLIFVVASQAQTIKVIPLATGDVVEIKQLYQEKAAVEKKIKDTEERIENAYLYHWADKSCKVTGSDNFTSIFVTGTRTSDYIAGSKDVKDPVTGKDACLTRRGGWEYGYVFSDDYQFITARQSSKAEPALNYTISLPYNPNRY